MLRQQAKDDRHECAPPTRWRIEELGEHDVIRAALLDHVPQRICSHLPIPGKMCHVIAARRQIPIAHGGSHAEILWMTNQTYVLRPALGHDLRSAIATAVIDHDDLVVGCMRQAEGATVGNGLFDAVLLIVGEQDEAEARQWQRVTSLAKSPASGMNRDDSRLFLQTQSERTAFTPP